MVLEAQNSESRVHAMSMLHEKFYNAEADHIINTRAYLTDLVHKLVDVYGVRTEDLRLSLYVDDIELDIDKALALSLIIQELVCNAFKYAFDHKPNPLLSVTIRSRGDVVVAAVKDNGIGLDDHSIGRSQGFSLVEALVAQLEGKMEYDNSNGTHIRHTISKHAMEKALVLVVEDQVLIAKSIEAMITQHGMEVIASCKSGVKKQSFSRNKESLTS